MLFFSIYASLPDSLSAQSGDDNGLAEVDANEELKRKNVAVALNYCRASFHRIRKYPSPEVMAEEQNKILNNLDLNAIRDQQIIKLYADVLDEIGQVQLSEKESDLFNHKYRRSLRQELAFDSLSLGLDLMTGQYIGAVRTGANSWWDYRNFKWQRDNELLKVEKTRVSAVVQKTTNFLDTFWKLTQQNNIPDRWLIRSTDLDDLEQAMNEQDPQVRLRILKRMEAYMECYPPYWYYLARTQQATGDLTESLATYQKLGEIAAGHFRRDDMMTSALTNQAVIQAHLGDPACVQTAQQALRFSTQVWEANLACAQILKQAGQLEDAEDAILRNLDVDLESDNSTIALLGFYYDTNNTAELARYLADEKVLARIPPPVMIRYASRIQEQSPTLIWTALASSLKIEPQVGFGNDSILLSCHPVWKITRSRIALHADDGRVIPGELVHHGDYDIIRFADVAEFGGVLSGPSLFPQLKLEIQYGERDPIRLAFSNDPPAVTTETTTQTVRHPTEARRYHLISAQWGQTPVLSLKQHPQTASLNGEPVTSAAAPFDSTGSLGGKAIYQEIRTADKPEIHLPTQQDEILLK